MKKTKTKKPKKVLPNYELDGEDAEMLAALENGEIEFERIPDYESFMKKSRQMAHEYFKKEARVSFRISKTDLNNVKRMAASEGLPYQTFLTSIIHKLTTGQLSFRPWH